MRGGTAHEAKRADALLRWAIAERRLVAFVLDGRARIGEPHDYGVVDGVRRLFFYQIGGESRSGPPVGWRWATVDAIEGLRVLDDTFPGPRPTRTGRHARWDALYATVSPHPPPPSPEPGRRTPGKRRR